MECQHLVHNFALLNTLILFLFVKTQMQHGSLTFDQNLLYYSVVCLINYLFVFDAFLFVCFFMVRYLGKCIGFALL